MIRQGGSECFAPFPAAPFFCWPSRSYLKIYSPGRVIDMKILVTGGVGYIGSHTCKSLAKSGHEVIVYDNLSTGHRDFARWGNFVHGDIRDGNSMRKALRQYRPDGIIHFAAKSNVGESVTDPGQYFSNNVVGALSLLEAMRDEDVHAIVVSGTCAVYGEPENIPVREDCPTRPVSPYGASKLFMERMLEDFSKAHGLRWVSLRYFNAAGSSEEGEIGEKHEPETHLIPRVMLAALGKIPAIDVYGLDYPTKDGTCIRDYIHVDDLADAHIRAMEHLQSGGENLPLNLGSGIGSSVLDIIGGVEAITGRKVPVNYVDRRPGDPALLIADSERAKNVIGWETKKNLTDMLASAWNYISKC